MGTSSTFAVWTLRSRKQSLFFYSAALGRNPLLEHNFPQVLQPSEAAVLRVASLRAVELAERSMAVSELDRRRIVDAVLWIARTGYTRDPGGSLDPDMLADAAIARFRAVSGT